MPLGNADMNRSSKAWDAIAIAALGTELQASFSTLSPGWSLALDVPGQLGCFVHTKSRTLASSQPSSEVQSFLFGRMPAHSRLAHKECSRQHAQRTYNLCHRTADASNSWGALPLQGLFPTALCAMYCAIAPERKLAAGIASTHHRKDQCVAGLRVLSSLRVESLHTGVINSHHCKDQCIAGRAAFQVCL